MFNLDYIAFAKYWASVGISMADAANLMGVHSAIDNEHGGPAVQWSSVMYQSQVCGLPQLGLDGWVGERGRGGEGESGEREETKEKTPPPGVWAGADVRVCRWLVLVCAL